MLFLWVNCVGGHDGSVSHCMNLMMWLSATFFLPSCLTIACKTSPFSFCWCALVVLHTLFLSLSLSLLAPSLLQSHDRGGETLWANSHLRCSVASPLTWLSWGSGVCRLLCSLWLTWSMAGEAASQTGLSEWWAHQLRCVAGALARGGFFGLDVFVFCRVNSRKQNVTASQFKMWEGRSKMEIQSAVHLHHGYQLDWKSHAASVCSAQSPFPTCLEQEGCAASVGVHFGFKKGVA